MGCEVRQSSSSVTELVTLWSKGRKGTREPPQSVEFRHHQIMVFGNSLFYPILGFASFVVFVYMSFGGIRFSVLEEGPELRFVERNGTQFVLDGKAFYVNGWNSYWLMVQSVDVYSRSKVREMMKTGAEMGLTVCRTWAFNDGDYNALQTSPGHFDEQAFQVFFFMFLLVF